MSEVNINYKGSTIAGMDASGTKTLLTDGKYCEDDIEVVYARPSVELVPFALRPDAELIQSYSYDKHIVADEGLTIPSYATTATTIKASANLSPAITVDLANYQYFVAERFLTIPEYSVTTKGKGRQEYVFCNYFYEMIKVTANTIGTIINPGELQKKINAHKYISASNAMYQLLYWTSSSAIALYATNAYGAYQTPQAPSFTETKLTIKSPAMAVRGHTTYFTSTFMDALTDIRFQYAIDVYRAPTNNLNIDGWGQEQMLKHIVDCVNSTDHTLT